MRYSKVQYLCWLFSGAEISLLKECPTDYNRQASIGFTILMTCLLAGLAGGFAASKFSGGLWSATVAFGIVWSLLIFSIDRSMVVTLKKDPTLPKQKFWIPFIARAFLAILLAFMISIPLEIYIFQDEIRIQLQKDDVTQASKQQSDWEKQLGLGGAEASRTRLEAERDRNEKLANSEPLTAEYQSLKQEAATQQQEEASKRAAAGRINLVQLAAKIPTRARYSEDGTRVYPDERLAGPAYSRWQSTRGQQRQLLNQAGGAASRHQKLKEQMRTMAAEESRMRAGAANQASVEAKRESQRVKNIQDSLAIKDTEFKTALGKKSFLREYVALENAAADPANAKLWVFLWLIRAIFLLFELLPTIVKLATPLGEYDRQVHAHERMFALALDTNYRILEQREELRQQTELQIAEELEQARREREIELGKNVLDQTATIQNALAKQMLTDWHKKERDKQKAAVPPKAAATPPQPPASAAAAGSVQGVAPVSNAISPPPASSSGVAVHSPTVATAPGVIAQPVPAAESINAAEPTVSAATSTILPSLTSYYNLPGGPTLPDSVGLPSPPPVTAPVAHATQPSITLAALTAVYQWKIVPDSLRSWYRFENGATDNRVRRYLGNMLESGNWEHPEGDNSRLRLIFNQNAQDFHIQRLTNQEMMLQNLTTGEVLTFTT